MFSVANDTLGFAHVTGAGSRIGLAVAKRLTADGFIVAINDLDKAVLGGFSSKTGVDKIVNHAAETFGGMVLLVNSAGVADSLILVNNGNPNG